MYNKRKAPKEATMKNYTFTEILNTKRGRELVDRIEEAESEMAGRGIKPEDTTEFWAIARQMDIENLKKEFGFDW